MNLPTPPILTTTGQYDLPPLSRGREYLLHLSGSFRGATLALSFRNAATGAHDAVVDGTWTGTTGDLFEVRFIAPSTDGRLTLSGASTSPATAIAITLVPLL